MNPYDGRLTQRPRADFSDCTPIDLAQELARRGADGRNKGLEVVLPIDLAAACRHALLNAGDQRTKAEAYDQLVAGVAALVKAVRP
jgi:hypothetical protein